MEDSDAAVGIDVERPVGDRGINILGDDGSDGNGPRHPYWFGWTRRQRSRHESIHLKTYKISRAQGVESPSLSLRLQAIEVLFGLSADYATKWPGILVFCQYLENSFKQLLEPQFNIIWRILGRGYPSSTVDCWHWCFTVIKIFQAIRESDASIEKVYERLVDDAGQPLADVKAGEKVHVLRAIFAVLCLTSATLKPIMNDELDSTTCDAAIPGVIQNSASLTAENSFRKYSSKDLRRPVSKFFYSFRNHDLEEPEHGNSSGAQSSSDVLYESKLNYFSLFTIGQVKLKWVDTLSGHLAFDTATRTLSIFCFPSFCVANILRQHDVKVLKNITIKVLVSHHYADSPEELSALHREILLSYRVLFGQCSKARKLLGRHLSRSPPSAGATTTQRHDPPTNHGLSPPSVDVLDEDVDPLLPIICTTPLLSHHRRLTALIPSNMFPPSVLDVNNQLQEPDTYSTHDDFPVFGQRLLKLQRYSMRQQPTRVMDLWRDRRNPLQWYTFWAVLWIGGASVVLALLQLLVSVAQAYLAVHS